MEELLRLSVLRSLGALWEVEGRLWKVGGIMRGGILSCGLGNLLLARDTRRMKVGAQ